MNINRHNYEIYFIDYLDGILTPAERKAVELFFAAHPDLKHELNEIRENICFEVPTTNYPAKHSLLRKHTHLAAINNSNFDELAIAYYENDLDKKTTGLFLEYLNTHPEKEKDRKLIEQTFLTPEIQKYTHKDSLMKPVRHSMLIRHIVKIAGLAASIALSIWLFNKYTLHSSQIIVSGEQKPVTKLRIDNNKLPEKNKQLKVSTGKHTPVEGRIHTVPKKYDKQNRVASLTGTKQDNTTPIEEIPVFIKRRGVHISMPDWKKPLPVSGERYPAQQITYFNDNNIALKELTLEDIEQYLGRDKISQVINLKTLADIGLKGFNMLTESNYAITSEKSTEGRVESIEIQTNNYKIVAPLRR